MVHFLNRKMHHRKSFQCFKRQRRGFLRQLINYFDAEQDTQKSSNRSGRIGHAQRPSGLEAIASAENAPTTIAGLADGAKASAE
jgi:hypothetical protein